METPTGNYALTFVPTCDNSESISVDVIVMIYGKEDAVTVNSIMIKNGFAVKFEEEQDFDGEYDWVELDPIS